MRRALVLLAVVHGCGFTAPVDGGGDGPMPLTVGFLAGASLQDESSGLVQVAVTLSEPAGDTVSVQYAFTGGGAINGTDYQGSNGVLTFTTGETQQVVPLTILSDAEMEGDETIELSLRSATNAVIGVDRHVVTISSSILPRVQFTAGSSIDAESVSPTLTLTLDLPAPAGGASVDYTLSGNASMGPDYTMSPGTIQIPANATTVAVPLPINDDPNDEFDEHVVITLTSSKGVVVSTVAVHDHTITDNDPEPTVYFTTSTRTETERDTPLLFPLELEVRLSVASGKQVKVSYTAGAGTASEGNDFSYPPQSFPPTRVLTFDPGDTTETIRVSLREDNLDEDDETVLTTLVTPVNATLIATSVHTLTITDDDPPPTINWGTPGSITANEGSANTNYTYNVVLNAPSSKTITVVVTATGSATLGSDYTLPTTSPVTFTPGQTTRPFTIQVRGDTDQEPDETVILTISGPTNATLGGTTVRTHTIQNDDQD